MTGILISTKNNILRNKWLSLATIIVATIVFLTASFFIALSLIAQRAVDVSQTKAQLQIYFEIETPEKEISAVRRKLEKMEGVENINYIDQEEALALYLEYYDDDPELVDSVSSNWLPASLEVRARTLEDLDQITEAVKAEKETNPYIEEVVYHEDVVNQLRSLSEWIRYGALALIIIFSVITVSLVFITIAFNINSHKKEIEIMHLIGTSDFYIKAPFILEGTFYTSLGAIIAATLIIIPLFLLTTMNTESNLGFIFQEFSKELDLKFLAEFSLTFVILFYLVHFVVGGLIGFLSSSFAVMKNLKLNGR